ncbi:type II toxin-antitoxin system RelE/ParE family toxin [Chryseobacterium sp. GP-SGM7]|uniref:type II toxin-antitoxin system RelE/ParE family toxin n=1 Tax=Chryseobacterium sp. GP-SGM7 TaxID=3411323 RepID=UPI003B938ED7
MRKINLILIQRKFICNLKKSLNLLKENPFIGQELFGLEGIHYVVILRKFSIFYRIVDNSIEILSFWDGHRNPEDFKI